MVHNGAEAQFCLILCPTVGFSVCIFCLTDCLIVFLSTVHFTLVIFYLFLLFYVSIVSLSSVIFLVCLPHPFVPPSCSSVFSLFCLFFLGWCNFFYPWLRTTLFSTSFFHSFYHFSALSSTVALLSFFFLSFTLFLNIFLILSCFHCNLLYLFHFSFSLAAEWSFSLDPPRSFLPSVLLIMALAHRQHVKLRQPVKA